MAKARPQLDHDASDASIEVLGPPPQGTGLRVDEQGLALLRERLRAANRDNPDFEAQVAPLLGAVRQALDGMRRHFPDRIVRVLATGTWATEGVDVRDLTTVEDLVLTVVFASERPDFDFDRELSMKVIASVRNLYGREFLLQFRTLPLSLWRHAVEFRRATGGDPEIGVPLLVRA